jgi:small subunit ribosomal protein S10
LAQQKIRINLKAYDHRAIDNAVQIIIDAVKQTGTEISGPVPLPTKREIFTILRSVHKHKDSREQFERRIHKRLIDILTPSSKAVDALTGLALPEGVDITLKIM